MSGRTFILAPTMMHARCHLEWIHPNGDVVIATNASTLIHNQLRAGDTVVWAGWSDDNLRPSDTTRIEGMRNVLRFLAVVAGIDLDEITRSVG